MLMLICERVNDAQNARVNGTTKWHQLQGMIPNIQEWHKRCLLLQVITNPNLYSKYMLAILIVFLTTDAIFFRTSLMNCTQEQVQEKLGHCFI